MYGKMVKVHEPTYNELKRIRDLTGEKSLDSVIERLIKECERVHCLEAIEWNKLKFLIICMLHLEDERKRRLHGGSG